jgi:pseudolysin/vibriolysin
MRSIGQLVIVTAAIAVASATQLSFVKLRHLFPSEETVTGGRHFGPTKLGFQEVSEEESRNGTIRKWQQTYEGIPVFGTVLTTHHNEDKKITSSQGSILEAVNIQESELIISPTAAVDSLKNYWNHSVVDPDKVRDDPAKLYVYPDPSGEDYLIYDVSYFIDSAEEPVYIRGLVKADSGVVIDTWDNIQKDSIRGIFGNGKTRKQYDNITVERTGNNCRHYDATRRIEVVDLRGRTDERSARSTFRCQDVGSPTFDNTNGAYSPRNDAYRNAQRFVDMWSQHVGVPPYASGTSTLKLKVHYSTDYVNAFFNGVDFSFGDGNRNYYPLTTLDIVCHEIGHAMTQWKFGGLVYRGQSGGMNEAYSDIVGETCDMMYAQKSNYLLGDDLAKQTGRYFRSMCSPRVKNGLDHFSQYRDNIDVHYTSGIYNKAWCLLSRRSGWDYIKAFKVFTQANRFYWGRTETMARGVCGVERAARDLRLPVADITNVFRQVGLSCPARERTVA